MDSIEPAAASSDMPPAAADRPNPPSLQRAAERLAPLAPDVQIGDDVPTRAPLVVPSIPASSGQIAPIAGATPRAVRSMAPTGTLVRAPRDLGITAQSVTVTPTAPASAAEAVRASNIVVPMTSVAANDSATPMTDSRRWTASQPTMPVATAIQLPRESTVASVEPTTRQAATMPGSPNVPTAPANTLVLPTAAPVVPATDAPASPPRWTATEATMPVALAVARPEIFQPQPGTVASAGQVFGAAIQAAQAATKPRDETDKAESIDAASFSAAIAPAQSAATTAATQAPLDMRQERWPHAMIQRIEILRDAADATDTRIRLVPDALGAIDVSMRKDGDTVHVHFNADQAATRTLLADAQPRLAELAEARGLKLGQGALGDGNTGSGQQRAPAPSQIPNRTPTTAAAMNADAADDTRIA